jgi:type I restriction enzyme, S subunit
MKLPDGWKQTEMMDLLEHPPQYGVNFASISYVEGVTPRLIRITDINGSGELIDQPRVGVTVDETAERIVSEGDLLLARSGATVGKSVLIGRLDYPAAFAGYLIRFRIDKEKADRGFIKQFLGSGRYWQWIGKTLRAGAQPNINSDEYCSLVIPLPAPDEQIALRELLEKWDESATHCDRLIQAAEQRKRGLMQQLLTGKTRFKKFKNESWRTVKIGSLLDECDRYMTWSDNQAYRFASIRRRSGGLFDRGTFYGREVKTKVLKSLKAGDFLISKRQVVHGAWAMVTKAYEGFGVSDEYDVLVNRDPKTLDMRFFNYLSQTRRLWHMAYLASNGVHIEKLIFDFDDFAKEKVRIPPTVEEQAMIVDVLSACDREIDLLQKQLAALKEQKRGLMQKLLTGEVRVKV